MSILCSMVGASFTVAAAAEILRSKKSVIAIGNAQVDTAQSKFGGASALFDGTGDLLTCAMVDSGYTATDLTIECWVRPAAVNQLKAIMTSRTADNTLATGEFQLMLLDSSLNTKFGFALGNNQVDMRSTTTYAANTWYHLAVTRNISTNGWTFYVNGTSEATATNATNFANNNIGIGALLTGSFTMNGHVDEVRISNTRRYTANFTPSTTPFVNDANTLLLLHMDGTDASTVFEDDNGVIPVSTRTAKTVTAVGNAQVDTAQYKFGSSSALFDGSGDYLTIPYSADITRFHDNTNFTIEYWIRVGNFSNVSTGASNASIVAGHQSNNGDAQWWSFGPISDGNVKFYYWSGAANQYTTSGVTLVTNTWYHLAAVKSTNSLKIYVDGVERGSGTISNTPQYSTSYPFILGSFNNVSFNGYLDEVRISNSARYTANFTAPTTPFVNDANTLLLMHMEGADASTTFTDDTLSYRTKKGLTAIGNAQVDTAQSQFGGSSALFDGTGDYLEFGNTGIGLSRSDNFTIECWFRANSLPGTNSFSMIFGESGSNAYASIANRSGTFTSNIVVYNGSNFYEEYKTISSISGNTWYHWAITKSGATIKHFFNGTELTTMNSTQGTMTSGHGFADLKFLGRWGGNTSLMWNGWIDEIRVSNTARYTTTFIPPTLQFVNDANTLLLIHCDGTDASTYFEDDNGYHTPGRIQKLVYNPNTNAQIDTAQSKFGGSSAYFDSVGDAIDVVNPGGDLNLGTNDFTIEGWIRPDARTQEYPAIVVNETSSGWTSNSWGLFDRHESYNTKFSFWVNNYNNGAALLVSTTSVSNDTWHHVAITRTGNTWKMYINGTEEASATSSVSIDGNANRNIRFGVSGTGSTPTSYHGWIDEFRISDIVRYTANFTPATTAFSDDVNTLLLLHFDGADASTVFVDDVGGRSKKGVTALGNAQIDTAQSKFGSSSALFDGTGDYLLTSSSTDFAPGTANYTLECWIRPTTVSVNNILFDFRTSSGDTQAPIIYVNSQGRLSLFSTPSGAVESSINTISANTWQHIAIVRNNGVTTLYKDGSSVASTSTTINWTTSRSLYICLEVGSSNSHNGHMDEIRYSNTARYTSNFTAPTAPFQNDENTLLLLHADGTDGSTVFTDDNGQIPITE